MIEFDPYQQSGEIIPMPDRYFPETDPGIATNVHCFAGLLTGFATLHRETGYTTAGDVYVYRVYWPQVTEMSNFYVRTNFDVHQHQLEIGAEPTVY